jgi:hypothetical protein
VICRKRLSFETKSLNPKKCLTQRRKEHKER